MRGGGEESYYEPKSPRKGCAPCSHELSIGKDSEGAEQEQKSKPSSTQRNWRAKPGIENRRRQVQEQCACAYI